jgi:D-glycero-D-manno-heptose 1,7-bisphosphate phosphatase
MVRRRAVFFDRDGVLNEAVVRDGRPYPPSSVAEVRVMPGAADALARLARAGFLLIGVTNQPDIARGRQRRDVVDAINAAIRTALPLDDLRMCPHDTPDGCACRKPKPGMLVDAAAEHGIDLAASVMVGDRWTDIEAGRRAGCRTVLIGDGYGEPSAGPADAHVALIGAAASWILGTKETRA